MTWTDCNEGHDGGPAEEASRRVSVAALRDFALVAALVLAAVALAWCAGQP